MKQKITKGLKWTAFSVLLLLLGVILVFGWIQTNPGRKQVAFVFGKMLSSGTETRVEFRGLTGFFPLRFRVDEIMVSDSLGPWLTATHVAARWHPQDLLHGYIRFKSIRAEAVDFSRTPGTGKPSEESSSWPPSWLRAIAIFRVENLQVEHFTPPEGPYAEIASLKVGGSLNSNGGYQQASLSVEGKTLTLRAQGAIQDRVLTVSVLFEEEAGGAVARAAGISGPLSVDLKGKGELQEWKGRLQAVAGGLGRMEADIGLEGLKVSARGKLHLDPKGMLSRFVSLAGAEPTFLVGARWIKPETLSLDHFSFRGEQAAMDMGGSLDLANGDAEGRFSVQCRDLGLLNEFVKVKARGKLNAEGHLSGRIEHPEISSHLRIEEGGLEKAGFSLMEGDIVVVFPEKSQWAGTNLRIRGNGHAKDVNMKDFREEDLAWKVALERPSEEVLVIRSLELRGDAFTLDASGEWKQDQRVLSSLVKLDFKLPASVPAFRSMTGKEAFCSAKIVLDKGKLLTFSAVHAETAGVSLDGSGTLDLGVETLDASFLLTLPRLNILTSSLGYPMDGSLRVRGNTRGLFRDLSTSLDASTKNLRVNGQPIEAGELSLFLHGLPPTMSGDLTLFAQYKGLPWKTKTDVKMERNSLSFHHVSVQGPQTHLDGELEVLLDRSEVKGKINGRNQDLSAFLPWAGKKLAGSAEIIGRFQVTPGSEEIHLEITGEDVSTRFGHARRVWLQSRVSGLSKNPRGTLEIKLEQAGRDEIELTKSQIRIEGNFDLARFSVTGEGHLREAFSSEASGLFSLSKESLTCERFQGTYAGMPVSLITPMAIIRHEEGLEFKSFTLKVGSGLIQGRGAVQKSSLDAGLQFENISLEKLPFPGTPNLVGIASGKINLNGNIENPEGAAKFRITGIELEQSRIGNLPRATIIMDVLFQGRKLRSHLTIEGLSLSPFEANLELPMNLSLSPFTVSFPPRDALSGDLHGQVNLERIPSLFSLVDQDLKGQTVFQLKLEGSLQDPKVAGLIHADKGTYENLRTGTYLTDIDLVISVGFPRLTIEKAKASDGEEGTVSAEGWLDLLASQGYPFKVEVSLDRAKLIRSDNAVAAGSGKLSLTGSQGQALITGRIVVSPAAFRIPKRLPAAVTEVEVIEINKAETRVTPRASKVKSRFPPIKLDVSASSPGRVHLEGRGLVSEWRGQLEVRGTTAKPLITGTLSIVRGQVDFLGKRFDLKSGSIFFSGSSPPSPMINVLAEAKTKDITARVSLVGPVTSPKIQLSSEPPLPSDEILSRLLFGRSAKSVSPVQAVELANALNTLAGGGGFDLLGRARRLIGVDSLTLNQSGENYQESTVSVGKYLSEDVYVEVEKGLSPETGKASLKWDVTPNITVGTETGVNAQAGVSVDWKWNY